MQIRRQLIPIDLNQPFHGFSCFSGISMPVDAIISSPGSLGAPVGWSALLSLAVQTRGTYHQVATADAPLSRAMTRLSQFAFDRQLIGLSADDRLIVDAAFSADPFARSNAAQAASAQRLVERWPRSPVYFASAATAVFNVERENGGWQTPAAVAAALDRYDRGEQLEPDNALYNVMKAVVLFRASSALAETNISSRSTPMNKPMARPYELYSVAIQDQEKFDQGLRELRKGLAKPRLTDHALDLIQEANRLLPRPDSLAQEFSRIYGSPYRNNGAGECGTFVSAYALQLAEAKPSAADTDADADTIVRLLDDAMRLNRLSTKESYVGELIGFAQMVALYRIEAMHALGRPDAAEAARVEFAVMEQQKKDLFEQRNLADFGAHERSPFGKASHAVENRLALAGFLAFLTLAAGWLLWLVLAGKMRDGWISRNHPVQDDAPPPRFIFIGGGRLARICLYAIVIPMILYFGWLKIDPFARLHAGPAFRYVEEKIEYSAMGALVLSLLWHLTRSAVRARAMELGIDVPPPARRGHSMLVFIVFGLSLFAVTTLLIIIGKRLQSPADMDSQPLVYWVWVPCTIPLLWIVANFIGRCDGGRRTRAAIQAVLVFLPMMLLSTTVSSAIVTISWATGLPISTFYLIGVSFMLAPIVLWVLERLGLTERANTVGQARFAPFHRLWAGSALPALGCAILILAALVGGPLRFTEARAVRAIDAAVNAMPSP
jgi:hypothetical protein